MKWKILLLVLLAGLTSGVSAQTQDVPVFDQDNFENTIPAGWEIWVEPDSRGALVAPPTSPGRVEDCMYVYRGQHMQDLTTLYFGGGQVKWEGSVQLDAGVSGLKWNAMIAEAGVRRGLLMESNNWTLVAMGPVAAWDSWAATYNTILRGLDAGG